MIDPLYTLSGFAVGALVGLTGVGGGSLMTPILILLFGVSPVTAIGTDLLFAACTKTVAAAVHAQSKTIDWAVTGRLAMGSIPATVLTMVALNAISNQTGAVAGVLTPILAVAILATAAMLLFDKQAVRFVSARTARLPVGPTTVGVGAALGFLVSLTSIGAGALGVTALTLLYPRLPMTRVVGSDIAHAIPLTLLAGIGYWWLGVVDWPLLGSLLSGSIPGVVLGSLLATRVPTSVLRGVLATVLSLVAGKLLA